MGGRRGGDGSESTWQQLTIGMLLATNRQAAGETHLCDFDTRIASQMFGMTDAVAK